MPITQRILISYVEFQRLAATEKRYLHLLDQLKKQESEVNAGNLKGAGSSDVSNSDSLNYSNATGGMNNHVIPLPGLVGELKKK